MQQSIGKSMDTQIDHAHMGIKAELLEWEQMRTWTTNEQCSIIKKKWDQCTIKSTKTYHMHHQTEIKNVRGKLDF